MKLLKLLFPACLMSAQLTLFASDVQAVIIPDGPGKTVKIGLLIPDQKSLAAKHGAEMAIRIANEKGGYNGRLFQLAVRSMEGPWGTGSKEAVNLIFDEEVWAIMGSHDGRNAHLVEQVSAKARIVFLSAWASDPTLSKAFVPWYFSCVPNDQQQAAALTEEIYNKRNLSNIAVVSDNGYDAKLGAQSFRQKAGDAGKPDPVEFIYDTASQNFNALITQLEKANVKGIVLFGQPPAALRLILQMRQRKMQQTVFGSLTVSAENDKIMQQMGKFDNIVLISSGQLFIPQGLSFQRDFRKIYGQTPDAISAYAFDGMNLLISAIKKAGLDRDKIQKTLTVISYEGATGNIRFDDKGNRSGAAGLMELKNGIPVVLGKD